MKKGLDIRAVIMAGGSGTRFWPLSRKRTPKQFLPIVSDKTMIEETVERLLPIISYPNIYTIANRRQTQTIQRMLPRLRKGNLLVEPVGKNTAPSLVLATARIYLQNPEAVVAALPSDHLILDNPLFAKKMLAAAEAASREKSLITFGIPPAFPSTGYGYIHYSKAGQKRVVGEKFCEVLEFKEKPDYEQARLFIESGDYYWNSGMFLWRADVFAEKLRSHAPDFYVYWLKMLEALKAKSAARMRSIFEEIPSISIDYALMEKAKGVLVCEGNFGWSDVGAWSSLADIWKKDDFGNAFKGECIVLDTSNSICFNPGKLTAFIGVKDLIVINTKDALLVCHKDQDQSVRQVLEALAKKGKTKYF
ncbi:MAG: mannose-1-phosphate guanylyltransferase [Candidatus Aminicenantes bacterium]|jgi:mannose-1-phosphate guanylyltransferase|nr:mannose-1-phosphate guanylyltransferase [Candidatus Aminicenantes bacterium]